MKVEIHRNNQGVAIYGYVNNRKVYCLEKQNDEDWCVVTATMPTGTVQESFEICRVSLKCHKVMRDYIAGHVTEGDTILLGTGFGV